MGIHSIGKFQDPPRRRKAPTTLIAALLAVLAASTATATLPGPTAAAGASPKKGVSSYKYLGTNPSKLTALGATWTYNWLSAGPTNTGMDYVPMVWGAGYVTPAIINGLRAGAQSGQYHNLLGFNEPDLSSQSNLTPQQAIDLWPQLQSTGLRLGSPAVANMWDGWLEQFMSLASSSGYRVDFIALHFYQDWTNPNAVNGLMGQLQTIYNKYHKPIWITEIGTIDVRVWGESMHATPTQQGADSYLSQIISNFESASYIERYAWFDDNCWESQECHLSSLYDGNDNITPTGVTYSGLA
jgi:hypothetical protein